jgi:rhamnosyltransferase
MPSLPLPMASVTVAFNPDVPRIEAQLRDLKSQVDIIIVVDNGSVPPLQSGLSDQGLKDAIVWITLGENRGIAGGLNAGIAAAKERGAEFVICMDHDSIALPGCIARLAAAFLRLEAEGTRVAAVGPRISDPRSHKESPFVKLGWLTHTHQFCSAGSEDSLECDFLISSGCFARVANYDESRVGALDEGLFIDSVDFEWCCRARSRGFTLYGICDAVLDHRLGDSRKSLLGSWSMIIHSPERLYYMTRNRIVLYGRGYVPLRWKSKDVLRMFVKLTLTLLFVAPRMRYLELSLKGMRDAVTGRRGPLH